MALANKQAVNLLFTNSNALFQESYKGYTPLRDQIVTVVTSRTNKESYNWAAAVPNLREWVSERTIQDLKGRNYTLENLHWESTVAINNDDYMDDNLGVFGLAVQGLAENASQFIDFEIFRVLEAGLSAPCFDGQAFFDGSHPVSLGVPGLGTFSNRYDTSTSSPRPLTYANLSFLLAQILAFKAESGLPVNVNGRYVLVVPPDLKGTADQLLNSTIIAPQAAGNGISTGGGSTNTLQGAATLVVSPYLTSATRWYLLNVARPVRPIIWQSRKEPEYIARFDLQSDAVFLRNELQFGVDLRGAAGYSFPQLAITADV